jgi:hypothetical protein
MTTIIRTFSDRETIKIHSLESGKRKSLFPGEAAWYVPTGHIIYADVNSTRLYAVPFNLDKLEVAGGKVPLMERAIGWSWSDTGTLIYVLQPETASQPDSKVGSEKSAVAAPRKINIVVNWFEELKQRVPTK